MNSLALLLMLAGAPAPAAVKLNTEGFGLYKQGAFAPALEKFQQAVAADDGYALAHYNVAAVKARLVMDDMCAHLGDDQEDVLGPLARAIALDPRRRARALVDPDFKEMREKVAFRRLVLGATERDSLRALLEGTRFTSFGSWGSFGNRVNLRFLPKGRLLLGLRVLTEEGSRVDDHPGTWSVDGTTLRIRMKSAADKEYSGDAAFSKDDTSLAFPGLGKLVNYLGGACDA